MLEFIKTIVNALKVYIDEKLVSTRPDWNQNDESAENYIENRTHWAETKETKVDFLPKCTVEVSESNDGDFVHYGFDGDYNQELIIGKKYTVTFDGEVFKDLICYDDEGYPTLGASWMNYSNYHFTLYSWKEDEQIKLSFYTNYTKSSHTLSVTYTEVKEVVHKIDLKYLPDDIGVQSDWNQNDEDAKNYIKNRPFYDDYTVLSNSYLDFDEQGNINSYHMTEATYHEDKEYLVLFDNVEYKTTWGEAYIAGGNCHYLGAAPITNNITEDLPFSLSSYISDEFPFTAKLNISTYDGEYTHDIKIVERDFKQLDEKFIPKFTEMMLVDKVTGLDYIISMIDGKIVYESLISRGIYVGEYPTQMIYGVNGELNTDGMIVLAYCQDGTQKEIKLYTCSTVDENGKVTITYVERGMTYTYDFYVDIIEYLEDFYYVDNGDGTVTITGWKGTCHGEPSTEMIFPDDSRVIL